MASSSTPLISEWHPDVTYDFTFRIGEHDYSTDLIKVEIRSSITMPYQHILLDVYMDPRDILQDSLFGQQPIKLIIRLKGKDASGFGDDVEFDLMYIDVDADYHPTQQVYMTDQIERSVTRLKAVGIKPYHTMSKMFNKIYLNKKPYEIISDLVGNTDATLEYDTGGRSKLAIDQLLVPPTTLYNVINYIDRTYGIFDGPMAVHTTFDNKIQVQNLNKKVNMEQLITLYLIATDRDESEVFESEDPRVFYSDRPVQSTYKGNAVFSVEAPTIRYIVKPRDTLSQTIEVYLAGTAQSYGVIEKNNSDIYFNTVAISPTSRIGIEKDQTGYDSDQTFIHSNLSQNILDMATLMASVNGNLPILNLMAVGNHVKVVSHVDAHMKLSGSYILKGSNITFMKATTWEGSSQIFMGRSNIAQQ
jgi:hypothetical protein